MVCACSDWVKKRMATGRWFCSTLNITIWLYGEVGVKHYALGLRCKRALGKVPEGPAGLWFKQLLGHLLSSMSTLMVLESKIGTKHIPLFD